MLPRRAAFVVALACAPALAHAEAPSAAAAAKASLDGETELPSATWQALLAGEVVRHPQVFDYGKRRFTGGVSYALVDASPREVMAMLHDVKSYRQVLPLTRSVRLVGENDGDRFVELLSGNSIASARYTLRMRTREAERSMRFWIEPTREHDIPDAWGFVRWQPVLASNGERLLLTYGALVELPEGFVRNFFEERIQGSLLSVLDRMTRTLDDRRLARRQPAP